MCHKKNEVKLAKQFGLWAVLNDFAENNNIEMHITHEPAISCNLPIQS
jgi:hypothetical protein